jgi:serine/threonine protein kinase/tetratricopeptide (TPR) repeat protein
MDNARRRQVEAVALEALARGAGERAAYLDAACAGDAELRREVESLLAGQGEAAALLESPPWAAPVAPPLAAGTRLGPYEIEAAIGAGGMGEVYKARDTRLGRTVAIKVLPPALAGDPERRRRFEQEARAVSALNHPHICPLFDVGEATVPNPESRIPNPEPIHYLVLAHLEGQTLAARLKKGAPPVAHVLELGAQMADALSAAHKAGIVHRDLKPANVMLTKAPAGANGPSGLQATLLDFGLAKLTGHGERPALEADGVTASASLTERGMVLGTVPYMAPEQVEGKAADARTDIWALGAVLYEMVTGRRAFEGETPTKVAAAILEREPAPVASLQAETPATLAHVIAKCLAKNPDSRWDTAHDVAEELRWLRAATGAASMSTRPASRRRRRVLTVAATAMVALAAGAYAWHARSRPILTDRDVILLADFANTTGDPVFDGTLKRALAMQLEQSPFLSLYSDEGVRDTLKRMNRSPDEHVTGPVAREIAQREGVKAVLEGSIAALGSRYVVMVSAIDAQTGAALAGGKEEAGSKEDVLKALDRLAVRLRRRLGESLESLRAGARLPEVTTPSLEALKAFDLGRREQQATRWAKAIPPYERAVELDPDFALALTHLAVVHNNSGGDRRKTIDIVKKAYALRDRVTESERLRILEIYHTFVTGDYLKRAEILELWSSRYPRAFTAHNNLALVDITLGRLEEALTAARRAVDLMPHVVLGYGNLASSLLRLGRFAESRATWEEVGRRFPDYQGHHGQLYLIALLQGDAAEARRQLDWSKGKPQEATFLGYLSQQDAQAGQLARAGERESQAAITAGRKPARSSSTRARNLALTGRLGPARNEVRAVLQEFPGDPTRMATAAFVLALAGEVAEAGKLADALAAQSPEHTLLHARDLAWIRAATELARGRGQEAIAHLAASKPYDRGEVESHYLRGLAYLQLKSAPEALAAFQVIVDRPQVDQFSVMHPLARLGRARAAALAGDLATARTAYEDFLTWWKDADQGLPVLVAAKTEYERLK